MIGCTPESQRCEFWAQGGAYVRPPCCTQHLKDLLFFTDNLLERHGIPHWLDFGALLGAVRSGEFVPWDGDVDFGVRIEDAERIRALEDEVTRAGHQLDMNDSYVWRILLSSTNTQHADLFPWRDDGGILKMRWPGYPDEAWSFPRRFVDNAQPIKLYGRTFLAPAPVEEFLSRYRYGTDYLVPRRFEDLVVRAKVAPSVRRFVAQRTFEGRLRRNVDQLFKVLDATPLRGCYVKTIDGAFDRGGAADDSPDAGFSYVRGAEELFVNALPTLEAAGFHLIRGSHTVAGANRIYRLAKDGNCFDFEEQREGAS